MVSRSPLFREFTRCVFKQGPCVDLCIHNTTRLPRMRGSTVSVHTLCLVHVDPAMWLPEDHGVQLLKQCWADHQLGQPGCHWNWQGLARGFLFSSFLQPLSFSMPLFLIWRVLMAPLEILILESLKARVDNVLETRSGQMRSERS